MTATVSIRKAAPTAAGGAAVLIAAMMLVAPWEGRALVPYKDIVGVWTVCEGVTGQAVVPGRRYSEAECDRLTQDALGRHYRGVMSCIHRPITVNEGAAIVSWAYNVGVGAACGSTLIRMLNAGAPAVVWCQELLRWNKAGGKAVRGLTNRRQAELKVCLGETPL